MELAGRLELGALPSLVGYALRRAQLAVFADFHEEVAPLGLRPAQYSVLLVLRANPGARASQVADGLGIQRANFAPMLAALELSGHVERRADQADRRVSALHLTPPGEALLCRADAAVARHNDRWRGRLGDADYAALLGLLHRLTA